MTFGNTEVFNITNAMRGMRNPMESWDKNDSGWTYPNPETEPDNEIEIVGKNDLELAQRLIKAGSEHRKFLRQIFVSVDITAPLYWWKEFDTYKIGTVSNSCSTMHKLASTPISEECFERKDYEDLRLYKEIKKTVNRKIKELQKVLAICERLEQNQNVSN